MAAFRLCPDRGQELRRRDHRPIQGIGRQDLGKYKAPSHSGLVGACRCSGRASAPPREDKATLHSLELTWRATPILCSDFYCQLREAVSTAEVLKRWGESLLVITP